MSNYLVTGGAGFIGSNIVAELPRQGHKVRVLDNFATGRRENLLELDGKIDLIEGDIRDLKTVERAVEDIEYVLHQAALPSIPRSVEEPLTSNEVNVTGTLNVLIASRDAGIKRVVYASSSSIYGNNPTLPKKEEMKSDPLSPYTVSKLAGERYCKVFYQIYGLETVMLRYFNIFGPRQDPTSQYSAVIPKFITAMLKGKQPVIYGDGEQSRDLTYVANAVQANILAVTKEGIAGEVFNIACGKRITINQIVKELNNLLGTSIKPIYAEPRAGDVRHSLADISKAKNLLNYEPKIDFREGLKRTIEWYANSDKKRIVY